MQEVFQQKLISMLSVGTGVGVPRQLLDRGRLSTTVGKLIILRTPSSLQRNLKKFAGCAFCQRFVDRTKDGPFQSSAQFEKQLLKQNPKCCELNLRETNSARLSAQLIAQASLQRVLTNSSFSKSLSNPVERAFEKPDKWYQLQKHVKVGETDGHSFYWCFT